MEMQLLGSLVHIFTNFIYYTYDWNKVERRTLKFRFNVS
jgi:hypothetical protein